jgi:hypothetical protein
MTELRMKSYIQPFERHLALRELHALSGVTLSPVDGETSYRLPDADDVGLLRSRLAYWDFVGDTVTVQAEREATVNAVRNGIPLPELRDALPFPDAPPLPNRRALRYGPHGIHEYRGKFFPQLVRSLLNIAGAPAGSVVLDPMVGSGTTPVEALLSGMRAMGIDMNPLSVLMARTKCALLSADPSELAAEYEAVRTLLLGGRRSEATYVAGLPERDQRYLADWFAAPYLAELDGIATVVASRAPGPARDLMWLSLSNILRRVSWQKTDDLRVRREVDVDADFDVLREFLDELGRSVRVVLALLLQGHRVVDPSVDIVEGDARQADKTFADAKGRVDVVVTSPPYATALPYLDTDRLSLVFLGLLPRAEHRTRDLLMIGNREVTDRQRRDLWASYVARRLVLPESVTHLIDTIDSRNAADDSAGFRKRNLAALLGKYFLDMRSTLEASYALMRPGAHAFVVVGNNTTTAGGQRVDITTAGMLGDIAVTIGFHREADIPMDMLTPRDIHRANSMPNEQILILRKP